MFPIVRVDRSRAESTEPLGTKPKFWFRDHQGRRVLFKAEERGTGDDWAEKIASELCGLLGLPHVGYELAVETTSNTPGVVCATCAPPPWALVLGNQLLLDRDPSYPARAARYSVRAHTVDAVADVVNELGPPLAEWLAGLPAGITSSLDVFAGYVMLDAWIANQDRHHENWAALRAGDALRLAPTFDHGASLARNISDAERQERLTTRDAGRQMGRFVQRARSGFFLDAAAKRAMTTVEAWQAFSLRAPQASRIWLDRLKAVEETRLSRLLTEVPPHRLSEIGREFTLRLLMENRRRLLEGNET